MQRAADQFVGTTTFRAVRSVGTETRTTVRTVHYFDVIPHGDLIECRVCANGFLYNMVRAMVGTMVYAAEGSWPRRTSQPSWPRATGPWRAPPFRQVGCI